MIHRTEGESAPDFKLLAVVADAPLAHFRRVLDGVIAKEHALKITAPAAG